jgi:hypothetical protein
VVGSLASAIVGDDSERNFQRCQTSGNRKAFFADQANIELCKIQRPSGDHLKRGCNRSGAPQPPGSRG